MRKLFKHAPSPAMVVAIVAVVLALGGSAVAALSKKDKKQVKSIANSEISKRASGLAVKSADTAKNADNAAALGGVAAASYTQGSGHIVSGNKQGANPSSGNLLLSIPGIGTLTMDCAANGIDSTLHVNNTSGSFLGDVGSTTRGTPSTTALDPVGPNIANGASVAIGHTGAGNTVGTTTLQLWNASNGKQATIVTSNVFCDYTAWASTNQ